MDALLLGMASQIAEREDHVVVEDVLGEAEAVPTEWPLGGVSAGAPAPGWEECLGLGAFLLSLLRDLLTMVSSV